MHWVSLFIELLRTRPVAVFWTAALTQAALWTLVPALVYPAPPGDLAEFLAVAHETGLGNPYGPPLAYWLAEAAFEIGGISGVYLLSQICVLTMLWAMFSLGRIIVGAPQAAIAVLLTAGIAVFDLLSGTTALRDRLEANTRTFRDAMTSAGFEIKPGIHPIVPIMLYDEKLAHDMARRLLDEGVYVIGFSYPVVPKGQARIRVQLSAAHEPEHIRRAVDAFTRVGHELGVLKAAAR